MFGVQELEPESRVALDDALPEHSRVEGDFPGWATQSNIWWCDDVFTLEDYGAEDIGIRSEHARLFWVRLRPPGTGDLPSLLFSTAHLTWPGHPQERVDDVKPESGAGASGGRRVEFGSHPPHLLEQRHDEHVAGHDDSGDGECVQRASLTTVRPHKRWIPRAALDHLTSRISGRRTDPAKVLAPWPLVVRESSLRNP